ncbi:hypothetical protein N8T08_004328 [Aspergillus melleus]|uniref:Uncharacterized protein n=1 Tax=Aspergillus melleus TaxID=138277 RepID=A0ACC3B523_9EURO|nr:hypothetical protein N8T08_004328 [Aspergillus melleus]
MGYQVQSPDGLVRNIQESMVELGWPGFFAVLLFVCISTRIITGLQSGKAENEQTRRVRLVPYWFPWIGHGFSFIWNHVSLMGGARDRMAEPVMGIYMGGKKHVTVTSPSLARSVMSSRSASSTALVHHALKAIFGDRGPLRNLDPANAENYHHTIPNTFKREPFLSEASASLVRAIERDSPKLVTFCHSVVDQELWERNSDLEVVDSKGKQACEVSLFALLRNFVGHATTTTLMGQAILEEFPTLLDDVWKLDDWFPIMALGLPRWIVIPGLPAAYAARDRLLGALAEFQQAFNHWDDGVDPGIKFRDLDDVCEPIKQRIRLSKSAGLSPQSSAPGHLALLWAMNGNAPNIVFWHILRLFADPTLLADIRKEIAPYVKASRPTPEETGFPFQEAARISIDADGLFKSCQLLKASYYETLRLDTANLSFREFTSDVTISESEADAKIAGSEQPRSYQVKKGTSVAISHGAIHTDPRYFSNPSQFDPLRFVLADPQTGEKQARLHTINPFGLGSSDCKGRAFAEREVLSMTSAVISLWDIESVNGEDLSLPAHRLSTGVYLPKKDIRVRVSARV